MAYGFGTLHYSGLLSCIFCFDEICLCLLCFTLLNTVLYVLTCFDCCPHPDILSWYEMVKDADLARLNLSFTVNYVKRYNNLLSSRACHPITVVARHHVFSILRWLLRQWHTIRLHSSPCRILHRTAFADAHPTASLDQDAFALIGEAYVRKSAFLTP